MTDEDTCAECANPLTAGDCTNSDCPECPPRRPTVHAFVVAVYLEDRAFGGREEGGWYYDCGELSDEHASLMRAFEPYQDDEAHHYAALLNEALDRTDNEGRREVSSVLSEGRFRAYVWDNRAPSHFPSQIPHYE